ncbi:uncharacterized protein HD556DRAFT_1403788 [Suillus plorans]|uniref:Uncharacterized protein n=1 Tax=Suillus plorans TaxID=116603 RepID=A0A9P7DCI1_9AGAM|nr:uncharacterized protein HD556DRAFT_1403788 [Suillus plorans]KAG1788490.1 hypothetical protein HD556DRAFT_1403788 [Suillus plorans]
MSVNGYVRRLVLLVLCNARLTVRGFQLSLARELPHFARILARSKSDDTRIFLREKKSDNEHMGAFHLVKSSRRLIKVRALARDIGGSQYLFLYDLSLTHSRAAALCQDPNKVEER